MGSGIRRVLLVLTGVLSLAFYVALAVAFAVVLANPPPLARALRRIQRASDPYRGLWSSLFVHGEEDAPSRLLATHPPMDDRIDRLHEMADARRRIPVRAT